MDPFTDPVLAALLTQVDRGKELPLIVSVGGTVISGVAVSKAKYMRHFARTMAEMTNDPPAARGVMAPIVADAQPEGKGPVEPPEYLHLSDARTVAGTDVRGDLAFTPPTFWRIALNQIDAFSFGRYGVEPNAPPSDE